jgi:transposase
VTTIAQIGSPRVTIGVDTHQDSHTAVALDSQGKLLGQLEIATTPTGYAKLLEWSRRFGEEVCFGVEGTGSFGAGLAGFLTERGYRVVEVDRPNRKARRLKGKSDPLDAEQAARQVLAGVASATPKTKDAEVEMIRALKVARASAKPPSRRRTA